MAAITRLKQGIRGLTAFLRPVDETLIYHYLTMEQITLFRQMQRSEQLHSVNVLKAVLEQEAHTPDDLAVAALLHDVGKSRYPMAIWQKTLIALVRDFLPGRYQRWAQGDGSNWWKRPFIQAEHHPAWSAELVAPTGASERALWLIRHHADKLNEQTAHPFVSLLHRLQQADDAN